MWESGAAKAAWQQEALLSIAASELCIAQVCHIFCFLLMVHREGEQQIGAGGERACCGVGRALQPAEEA